MSLEIVRQVDRDYPQLLQTNIGATCHQFTLRLREALTAAGHDVALMGKTRGEGQYTPPGFAPRTLAGLDGKPYVITGVSHDALWVDGQQVDTIAGANDADHPIYNADGSQIRGVPVWNPIPQQYWRPNNPPVRDLTGPPPPSVPQYPPYPPNESDVDGAGVALFADFAQAGQAPNPQMLRFAFRIAYSWLTKEVADLPASVKKHRAEWRALLGLPPL